MKSWTWHAKFAGLWAVALAVAVVWHLGGRGGAQAPPPTGVELYGPDLDFIGRLESKHRLTAEVIAGRLSLVEAAAAFQDADSRGRPSVPVLYAFPGAASEDEAYCRCVIAWVGAVAPRDRADELTGRLQAELDARLRDGCLQLPDP